MSYLRLDLFDFLQSYQIGSVRSIQVAGVQYTPLANQLLATLIASKQTDIVLKFVYEPENPYDPYAVKIFLGLSWAKQKYHIGYVPKTLSKVFTEVLKSPNYTLLIGKTSILITKRVLNQDFHSVTFEYKIVEKIREEL